MPGLGRHPEREFGGRVPLRRVFGAGEDPLTWSAPIGRIAGLGLRLHLIVPLWAAAELAFSLPHHRVGPMHVGTGVAAVLVIALIREVARALVSRSGGAEEESIVVWPLGGLTGGKRAGFPRGVASQAGGLAIQLLLVPILAGAVWASGADPATLLFNPFEPRGVVGMLASGWQVAAWWLFYANVVVLLASLLPMRPFDGARLLEAWVCERRGAARANDAVTRVGLFAAVALLVFAAAASEGRLIAVAFFSAAATVIEFRKAEFLYANADDAAACPDEAPEPLTLDPPEPSGEEAGEDPGELDRVLERISSVGLAGLSDAERELLRRETERRRTRGRG